MTRARIRRARIAAVEATADRACRRTGSVGVADLRDVGDELSALARACLAVALDLAAPTVPLAIIGMGKLGGCELNYASDVDVMFVHDGDSRRPNARHRGARDDDAITARTASCSAPMPTCARRDGPAR